MNGEGFASAITSDLVFDHKQDRCQIFLYYNIILHFCQAKESTKNYLSKPLNRLTLTLSHVIVAHGNKTTQRLIVLGGVMGL